jgi:hypothetical protein
MYGMPMTQLKEKYCTTQLPCFQLLFKVYHWEGLRKSGRLNINGTNQIFFRGNGFIFDESMKLKNKQRSCKEGGLEVDAGQVKDMQNKIII